VGGGQVNRAKKGPFVMKRGASGFEKKGGDQCALHGEGRKPTKCLRCLLQEKSDVADEKKKTRSRKSTEDGKKKTLSSC